MKIELLQSIFFLLLGLSLFGSPVTQAQATNSLDIVINEIAWMGTTASTADEWIVPQKTQTSTLCF